MDDQVPSMDELRASAQKAAESAQASSNSAQNFADQAKEVQQQAVKSAELAESQKGAAEIAKTAATHAAEVSQQLRNQAKESADGTEVERQRAFEAAKAAEEALSKSQIGTQEIEKERSKAEESSIKAEEFSAMAKGGAAASVTAQEQANAAANSAAHAKKTAESAATVANMKLAELNKTLENAITATLGGAFQKKSERSRWLDFAWLVVLVFGIFGILIIGYLRYEVTAELIRDRAEISYIALQVLINLVSMSGPIWLSWVATLRLAKTHAVTEDYSYKAALAQAYQGYSTSVAEEDELLKYRLFATVITQLDASPVRFLSEKHPATPFQDLLQQPWMEEMLNKEPIKGQFMNWFASKFTTTFKSKMANEKIN
jgi:hypothetical protein